MKVKYCVRIVATNKCEHIYMHKRGTIPDGLPICTGFTFFDGDSEFTVADMEYDMKTGTLDLWKETIKTDQIEEIASEYTKMGWKEQ